MVKGGLGLLSVGRFFLFRWLDSYNLSIAWSSFCFGRAVNWGPGATLDLGIIPLEHSSSQDPNSAIRRSETL